MAKTAGASQKTAPHKAGRSALAKHADKQDTIEFSEEVRVGTFRFFKGVVAQFEDPAMAAYFDVCFNGTEFTSKDPNVVITEEELNFDPDAEGQTVDPHTVIGTGRSGIQSGKTVFDHLTGGVASRDGVLDVHESVAGTSAEG